ncbi:hypothetical protein [Enterovirga rhinocerotis]|uniref:DUF962 domain-containing protein n=1 Tax=Enterovirga rhinocerotis TaxID=1339210 RepID=A0A4R7C4L1_9HYPH|nr:hypothetical protein [Enterovirga rhinocerotis]TDR93480.1 hypothetical protein EV668_0742 [Enterovirga rhinocerotis]
MTSFREALRIQRWDDHRYYHHSRINQALHLVSAISFIAAYVIAFKDLALAALIGWLFSMTTRQAGHFFFEPHEYDHVNHASHEHKEEIKVGYNLFRKVILMSIWVFSPLPLLFDPTYFGVFTPAASTWELVRHVGYIWFAIALGGLVFRVAQLCVTRDVQTGLVWGTKILTDPFHDIKLYWRAPFALMRGELIDPREGHSHA